MSTKYVGSILILTGTALGAGMLALPLVSGAAGFTNAELLLVFVWILMTLTGLLVLETCLALAPENNNFHSMAKATIGPVGQVCAWIVLLFLLYSLTAAYISGGASLITSVLGSFLHLHVFNWVDAILFTMVLGGIVFWSTRAVDLANRTLISLKGLALVVALALLLPKIDLVNLAGQPGHTKYLWMVAPIFLTSFGFHTVIPTLAIYLNKDARALRKVIIIGAAIPFGIYTLWLLVTLGIIPLCGDKSFQMIAAHHYSVGLFIGTLNGICHNKVIETSINLFSNIAMSTSFLGVTLGLFDFLGDGLRRPNTRFGRFNTALITFAPPLVFALIYPKGFIIALGFAAICVAILEVVMPAMMVYKLRKSDQLSSPYRMVGGNGLPLVIFLVGVVLVAIEIADKLSLLPVYQ